MPHFVLPPDSPVCRKSGSNSQIWLRKLWNFVCRIGNSRAASEQPVTRAVFFDFDRTLTVVHVFKSLAGWIDPEVGMLGGLGAVTKPHAITERGQLLRASELGTAWIEQAFGGNARVRELRCLLARLAATPGCRVILLTRGYIGVVRKCMLDLGLLQYFYQVYGNIGSAYGRNKEYDVVAESTPLRELECLLGDEAHGSWESKSVIMLKYKEAWSLGPEGVIFIDDDRDEIWSVNHCLRTIHVRSTAGITAVEVAEILNFVGIDNDVSAQSILQGWAALPDPLTCRPPPIMTFNRAHLPVLLGRHLASLTEELYTCENPMRRIKLLLREPLLLLSVAHREFVRQQVSGNTFTLKNMKPMLQCMHAQAGLRGDTLELPEDTYEPNRVLLIEHAECQGRPDTDESNARFADGWDSSSFEWSAEVAAPGRIPSKCCNLYAEIDALATPEEPAKVLCSAVSTFQSSLLGLTPITLTTTGANRPVVGCHDAMEMCSDEAVWSRYAREERLGSGHFGEVYKARHVCSGKDVAVKVLERIEHDNEKGSPDDEDHPYQDASLFKALFHPNLLRIFEAVKTVDQIHIVTELAVGGSLSAYSKRHQAGGWIPGAMQQVVSAVAYCHHRNVLHGDIKPENVLVGGTRPDQSPLCIVCDFGHTTICIGGRTPIAAPGDPRYIAPEVMAEEFLSPRSDVYMLAVTAYELLTGGWLPFYNQKAVTLHASYYQLKLGGVRDRILSNEGLGWREWERLRGVDTEAKELLRVCISRQEQIRPTALEMLKSKWLQHACSPCKAAYDAMFGGSGWGLWSPRHLRFAQRLEHRSKQSWAFRWICSLIGIGLDSKRIQGVRLLFRRMDHDANGAITRKKFQNAAGLAGLTTEQSDVVFKGANINERSFIDFKDFVMLCLDLDVFSDSALLHELRSLLSYLRGPAGPTTVNSKEPTIRFRPGSVRPAEEPPESPQDADRSRPQIKTPVSQFSAAVLADRESSDLDQHEYWRGHGDPQVERALSEIWSSLEPDVTEINAPILLKLLRAERF